MDAYTALNHRIAKPDLLVVTGSRLYGTDGAQSDTDKKGVLLPPWEFLSLDLPFKTHRPPGTDDIYYSLFYFLNLLGDCSPQQVEMLFAPDDKILHRTAIGEYLLSLRPACRCEEYKKRVLKYATNEWAKARNPNADANGGKVDREQKKFGYAVTQASHVYRTLTQAIELLKTGTITFPRPDASFLKQIKQGEVAYEALEIQYHHVRKQLEQIYTGDLPEGFYVEEGQHSPMPWYRSTVAKYLLNDPRLKAASEEIK